MDKWQTWLDKQIHEIIGDGNVSHLPKAGQKFDWGDESLTPADMRMAFRIMKENDIAPDWIAMGEELEAESIKIGKIAQKFRDDYRERVRDAEQRGSYVLLKEAEDRWASAQTRVSELVDVYNKRLLTFNILKPTQIQQRVPLKLDALLK